MKKAFGIAALCVILTVVHRSTPMLDAQDKKGPLADLPNKPGSHIEKIKELGDNARLNLGAPGADPPSHRQASGVKVCEVTDTTATVWVRVTEHGTRNGDGTRVVGNRIVGNSAANEPQQVRTQVHPDRIGRGLSRHRSTSIGLRLR
jgi:hypothetical protein